MTSVDVPLDEEATTNKGLMPEFRERFSKFAIPIDSVHPLSDNKSPLGI